MIRRENWLLTEKFLEEGLREANPNISTDSIERYQFSLKHLLLWADELSFEEALKTKKPPFTCYVANLPARRGDGKITLETQKKIILVSKNFLEWAKENNETGVKKISLKNLKGLVHPKIFQSASNPISVSYDEIIKLASFNCGDNLAYKRDLAAMCFAFLSGARVGAIASTPIKAINLDKMVFLQYPELGVKTKNNKSGKTSLLPIHELISIVKQWDSIVRENLPETALWYPPLDSKWGEHDFTNDLPGENRSHAMTKRFGVIYEKAGIKDAYKSPHKFRHGHAVYALSKCKNMAQYQAVSRNLLHSSLAITDKVYAVIEEQERQNIFSQFVPDFQPIVEHDLESYLKSLCRDDRVRALHILVDYTVSK